MQADPSDPWARWLLHDRFGGDPYRFRSMANHLRPQRDRVLANARIGSGNTILDVGCGDGLLGFGALPVVGPSGTVIFSDVSHEMLDYCRTRARDEGVLDRCRFIPARSEDLSGISSASVDAVVARSVLIYVTEKQEAFREFHRVLRDGGRLSIFEPIAGFFGHPPPPNRFGWQTLYDVTPIKEIAAKVQAIYNDARDAAGPITDASERDLVRFAERAGFSTISLQVDVTIAPARPVRNWDARWHSSPNPLVPTLAEAVDAALTRDEAEQFVAYLRPLMCAGKGEKRSAVAYLQAVK